MFINKKAQEWCEENYDPKNESFYMNNAKYIAFKTYGQGYMHQMIGLIVALIASIILLGFPKSIIVAGSLTVGMMCYSLCSYGNNKMGTGGIAFVVSIIVYWINTKWLPVNLVVLKSLIYICIHMFFAIIGTTKYLQFKKIFKADMEREYEEEKEAERKAYESSTNYYEQSNKKNHYGYSAKESYQKTRYTYEYKQKNSESNNTYEKRKTYKEKEKANSNASSTNSGSNTCYNRAEKEFSGYTSDASTLKSRYRQLAKKYHPDLGGDEEMFKAVAAVYDKYKKTVA